MSEYIENVDSTWFNSSMYYMKQFGTFTKDVIVDVIPCVLAIKALAGMIYHINPSFCFRDDLADPKGENFIVTHDNKKEIARKFVEKRVSFAPGISNEDQVDCKKDLIHQFTDMFGDRLNKINSLAQQMGVQKPVLYAVSMPKTPVTHPFRAIGDQFSLYDPVIQSVLPAIHVTSVEDIQPPLDPVIQKSRQDFILAHEMAHIKKGDYLVRLIGTIALAALNIGLWVNGLSGVAPLATKITETLVTGLVIHAIARLFYIAWTRHQENRADRMAMDTLHSSEGAKQFFGTYPNSPYDLEHPAATTRLGHAYNWHAAR